MRKTIVISEAQARLIVNNKLGEGRYSLNESMDLNGVGGINCYMDFDEEEYEEWLQEYGKQDTQETKTEYISDYCVFTVEFLDSETMHGMGQYQDMSYEEIFENFGYKMACDIVESCMDGKEHMFDFYDYADSDEFDLSNTEELNRRAKNVMTVVSSPCGKFRGWILSDGTVLDAGWDHNACFKISPNQIKYREDFTLLGNVRFSDVSLEFGKYPTSKQLSMVRMFCEYHSHDGIFVDFHGGKNGWKSKQYNGLDYSELCNDLYNYYTKGTLGYERELYESVDEKTLYHGTNADFDKFSEEFYLSGVGKMDFGYGVYLTNSMNTAKEYGPGGLIMVVDVPDGKYLSGDRISPSVAMDIARKFFKYYLSTDYGSSAYKGVENEFWEYECSSISKCYDGNSVYGTISTILGSDSEASAWLRSIGYIGLTYKATNRQTGEKFINYVIFSPDDIKITKKIKA